MTKILLYPPPLEPSFAYISDAAQKGNPITFIDAGIHGNEKAPVEAVNQSLEQLLTKSTIIIPVCNPVGYKNNTRYIDSNPDWDNAAHSVGDMGHLLAWLDSDTWKQPSGVPDNAYCDYLGKFALDICSKYDIRLVLDLHEDDHPQLPSGGYIYSMNNAPVQPVLDIYKSQNMQLLNSTTRFGEPIVDGVVKQIPNGSFPELIIDRSANAIGYTIETTQNQDFKKRVALHKAILRSMLKFE